MKLIENNINKTIANKDYESMIDIDNIISTMNSYRV